MRGKTGANKLLCIAALSLVDEARDIFLALSIFYVNGVTEDGAQNSSTSIKNRRSLSGTQSEFLLLV